MKEGLTADNVEVNIRACTRKDFKDIGAEHIYDRSYKSNDKVPYLMCLDKPDNFVLQNLKSSSVQQGVNF